MNTKKLNRRDFLKLAGALPLGWSAAKAAKSLRLRTDGRKNVIVIVFDAWSARNVSLYGYKRETTPHITRLAERATVYHNHFAGSNFTPSGTGTLLTGTLPWTHRALERSGTVSPEFARRTLFSVFKDYYRIAYSHNDWANIVLAPMAADIDEFPARLSLFLRSSDVIPQSLFSRDKDIAAVSWIRGMKINQDGYAYSLFLSRLASAYDYQNSEKYQGRFPRGLPMMDGNFILEHATDWIAERAAAIDEPFVGYFHLLPPHGPYRAPSDFARRFSKDGYQQISKPTHVFAEGVSDDLVLRRQYYDEFVLYVDSEFNRLFKALEDSGALENSWVVLTSDHGESFERGISGHSTKALYQPLVRIPLLIFEPGKSQRRDVYTPTSAADVLPTLAFLNGLPIPQWTEGRVLPPYQPADENRGVYSVYSIYTRPTEPIKSGSMTLVKGKYKLHYYAGYPETGGKDLIWLYDIESDPEELEDLTATRRDVADAMLAELKAKLAKANQPYL
jgi:arylsulfatase A-like enzyme